MNTIAFCLSPFECTIGKTTDKVHILGAVVNSYLRDSRWDVAFKAMEESIDPEHFIEKFGDEIEDWMRTDTLFLQMLEEIPSEFSVPFQPLTPISPPYIAGMCKDSNKVVSELANATIADLEDLSEEDIASTAKALHSIYSKQADSAVHYCYKQLTENQFIDNFYKEYKSSYIS